MTSTVSFKEKLKQAFSFFKWELKSCSGTLSVYSILASVFTVIILTLCLVLCSYSNGYEYSDSYLSSLNSSGVSFETAIQMFQIISSNVIFFLTAIFTIIYTIKVFSYLHNKRQADLYGALPVSRITLFFSKSASAFIFSLVPALFFLGIISIVSIICGQPLVDDVVQIYIKLIIGSLACISSYGLVSICCGTTMNSIIMFLAVCASYPICAMFVKSIVNAFFIGTYSELFKGSFIMDALNTLSAYQGVNVWYWLAFTVVCVISSAFLVKKRKSERAQSSFAYYIPCHIVKVLVALLFGLFLGVLFGSLNVLGYGYLGFVFGFILGSVPAFIICHLIFYKGFSKIIKTSVPLLGLIVFVVAGMAVCNFDVFGYNKFVPSPDQVKSAGMIDINRCFYESDENLNKLVRDSYEDFTDEEYINKIRNCHMQYLANIDDSSDKKFIKVWYNMFTENIPGINNYNYGFSYKLNNGRVVTRIYSNDPVLYTYGDVYTADIVYSKQYFTKYSAIASADVDYYSYFNIYGRDSKGKIEEASVLENTGTDIFMQTELTEKIVEAFKKDVENDTKHIDTVLALKDDMYEDLIDYSSYLIDNDFFVEPNYNKAMFDYYLDKGRYPDAVCAIELCAETKNDSGYSLSYMFAGDSANRCVQKEVYLVPNSYTNTIKVLQESGILNKDMTMNSDSSFIVVD